MIFRLLKGACTAAFVWLLRRYRTISLDLLKIHGAAYYVRGVQGVRYAALMLLVAAALVGVGVAGFLLIHLGVAAVIYDLAGSWLLAGAVLLALGMLYVLLALFALRYCLDERRWMRWTGASRLVAQVTRGGKKP